MDRPIIVLGAPRSGTSMTAGMLHHCGAWVGRCRGANKHNPRGYFENYAIESMRKHQQLSVETVTAVLQREGYTGGPWLYKSSPWGWAMWKQFEPVFVLVRRNPERSLVSWRRKRPDVEEGELRMKLNAHNAQLDKIQGITVDADSLVYSRGARESLVAQLGLPYTDEADAFVEPELWH